MSDPYWPRHSVSRKWLLFLVVSLVLAATVQPGNSQNLRFDNYREVRIPDYATLHFGPFYSTVVFYQSVGYRYVRTSGSGTDFLFENQRGVVTDDGDEFPLISGLNFRNYVAITRRMDLDLSVGVRYELYPMNTQEDAFYASFPEEGIDANLSTEFRFSEVLRGRLYDSMEYRTDYVDTRGEEDRYGGREFTYFANRIGAQSDWMFAKKQNLALTLSRYDLIPRTDEFNDLERFSYREGIAYEYEVVPGFVAGVGVDFYQTDYDDPGRLDTRQVDYSVFANFARRVGVELSEVSSLLFSLGYSRGTFRSARTESREAAGAAVADDGSAVDGEETVETEQEVGTFIGSVTLKTRLRENLGHSLTYARSVSGGFDSAFNIRDKYGYALEWAGHVSSASFYSTYFDVQPSDERNDYSDWVTGLTFRYPVIAYIALHLGTSYRVRENKGVSAAGDEVEEVSDHDTWVTRIGTSFELTKKIDFRTYLHHVERFSEEERLEYDRDIFETTFTFSHQF